MNFRNGLNFFTVVLFLLGLSDITKAQESVPGDDFSIGIQLNQYQQDFGTGLTLTGPWFAPKKIALRARGNLMFHEHVHNQETTWSPYINATFGVAGKTGRIGDSIRLYGEGGIIGLFLSDNFSSELFELGGYGLFGFEFFMNPGHNYFIEIGTVGTGAQADKVVNEPVYSNGLTISTGFRFSL